MLHWPVWDTGKPMAVDVPIHMRKNYGGFYTQTVELRIYDVSKNEWIESFPMTAWDTKNCDGPLTHTEDKWPLKPH